MVSCLKHKKLSLLRRNIREFYLLRKTGQLGSINTILTWLRTDIYLKEEQFLGVKFDKLSKNNYFSVRFFTPNNLIKIQSALTGSLEKKAYCLPLKWRRSLRKKGFLVSNPKSELLWKWKAFLYWGYGVIYGLKIIFSIMKPRIKDDFKSTVYLHKLTEQNLTKECHPELKTIVNFMSDMRGKEKIIAQMDKVPKREEFTKNTTIVSNPFTYLPKSKIFEFLIFSILLNTVGLFNIIFGDGEFAVLSTELQNIKLAQLMPKDRIHEEYAFHNTSFAYQPAWTNIFKEKGAKVSLYFYSMNCLPFHIDGHLKSPHFGYENITWPNYIVWKEQFISFLKKHSVRSSTYENTPPIYFSDKVADFTDTEGAIVIFNVSPSCVIEICRHGIVTDYYLEKNQKKFFFDIIDAASKFGRKVFIKQKRSNSFRLPPAYTKLFNQLAMMPNVELVDPDISAYRLINNAAGVISMPFTSTAHIAEYLGKPSVFYDFTSRISDSEPTGLGVPMIQSPKELNEWISRLPN